MGAELKDPDTYGRRASAPRAASDNLSEMNAMSQTLFTILDLPQTVGRTQVTAKEKTEILRVGSGFLSAYDYSLNAYIGCQFGCAYCYAVNFLADAGRKETWGEWLDVKTTALAQLRKKRAKLEGKSIYMSPATDPYTPIEGRLGLTRSLLEEMASWTSPPRLVVQTRSPLVVRDFDLLAQFPHARVNMTITTDSEAVRRRFEGKCPSVRQRVDAARKVKVAGVKLGVCMTPLLPLDDTEGFALQMASLSADSYVAQAFHQEEGGFRANTRPMGKEIAGDLGWTDERYREAFRILRRHIPTLLEGQEGFAPE